VAISRTTVWSAVLEALETEHRLYLQDYTPRSVRGQVVEWKAALFVLSVVQLNRLSEVRERLHLAIAHFRAPLCVPSLRAPVSPCPRVGVPPCRPVAVSP